MSNSQPTKQAALGILSTLLDTVSRETESVFTVNLVAVGQADASCRLLEVKAASEGQDFAFRLSESLVFQIVDLMAGGLSCHFTKIVGKPLFFRTLF